MRKRHQNQNEEEDEDEMEEYYEDDVDDKEVDLKKDK